MKRPTQPVLMVGDVARFKPNLVVIHLYEWALQRGHGMNELASLPFSDEDRTQFAQLIGCGAGDLSYFNRSVLAKADAEAAKLLAKRKGRAR